MHIFRPSQKYLQSLKKDLAKIVEVVFTRSETICDGQSAKQMNRRPHREKQYDGERHYTYEFGLKDRTGV